MASYKQVGYGSQGSDVKTLQEMLNSNGYQLDVDGIFGSKTQAAVKDYQQKNNLAVDGIVGTNTWGSLTKANTQASFNTAAKAPTTASGTSSQNKTYQESDVVKQAQALLQQQMAQKPGAYQSQWQAQLDEAMNKILNREKFSYDLNGDALYQQYKDQYMLQGQQAMMDTMGQAQAMTGGYGNSYAQSVGQQTYQGYLQQLNDRIPELYQLALNKHQMEGDEMARQLALIGQMEDKDYGRYRDQMSDWQAERDWLQNRYDTERGFDYGQYRDDVADKQWQDAFDYQKDRDTVADQQWQKEFDEAIRQFNHANGISTGSTGGNTGGGDTPTGTPTPSTDPNESPEGAGKPYNNGGLSTEEIKAIQKTLGVTVDGKWGPDSQAAAKAMWGVTSATQAQAKNNSMKTNSGFTGSTYNEAVDYMKKNGVSSANASGAMTQTEWQRRRNSYLQNGTGGAEVRNYSTYKAYLKDYVQYQTEKA